jgi:hypothetical protein
MHNFFVSQMISPIDLLQPSPAPHFITSQVFLIYFPNCPSFSTIQNYAPNVAFYYIVPYILAQFAGKKKSSSW